MDRVRSDGAEIIGTRMARIGDSRNREALAGDYTTAFGGQVSQGTGCTTHRHCTVATSFAIETGSQAEAPTQTVNETGRSAETGTG